MNEPLIYNLGETIVKELFPEEQIMYTMYGSEMIKLAINGEDEEASLDKAEFDFAEEFMITMNVGIAIATLVTACVQLKASVTEKNQKNNKNKEIIDLFERLIVENKDLKPELTKDLILIMKKMLCP